MNAAAEPNPESARRRPAVGLKDERHVDPQRRPRADPADGSLAGLVELRAAAHSLQALERDAATILDVMPRDIAFDLSVDVKQNRIDITVATETSRSAFVAAGRPEMPSTAVLRVGPLASPTADIYGGLVLGGSGCMTGFSVKRVGYITEGVTTAGHCSNTNSYGGSNLPFQKEVFTGSHDEQWHTSPSHIERNKVWDGSVARYIRAKVSRNQMYLDQWVCKYGQSTGYDCGRIVSRHEAPSYIPNASATTIQASNPGIDLASSGDSGGPVFYTDEAWGTITGHAFNSSLCYCDVLFIASNYVESGLGVAILTS